MTIMTTQKIFILGLPRTSTTSICLAMLDMGYTVAHTCYTQKCLTDAEVIADTPVFNDYQLLDKAFEGSKFINLERQLDLWVPSIKQLLQRMHTNVIRKDGGFNPHIKRCFSEKFAPFTLDNINNDDFLKQCYNQHQSQINHYFKNRSDDLLSIDISKPDSYQRLLSFLQKDLPVKGFEKINIAGKVRAWKDINHRLKIEGTRNGRIDKNIFVTNSCSM